MAAVTSNLKARLFSCSRQHCAIGSFTGKMQSKKMAKTIKSPLWGKAADQGILRQTIQEGLQTSRTAKSLGAWFAQNRGPTALLRTVQQWRSSKRSLGGRMASLYTETANHKRLALDAVHKLANEKGKSMPPPNGGGASVKSAMKTTEFFLSGGGPSRIRTRLPLRIPC